MIRKWFGKFFLLIFLAWMVTAGAADDSPVVLVIHGGAGTIKRENMDAEKEAEYHAALRSALATGHGILRQGGSSLDAVVATLTVLEDSPLFNAGKGAVFNGNGQNELDASIMDGSNLNAGAVAGVKHVKNPIVLARKVMENSRHVLLTGEGAEEFAKQQGLEFVSTEYFFTPHRWQQLEQRKLQEASEPDKPAFDINQQSALADDRYLGTVGAVALDRNGNLAAGTSTGGLTNKHWGRVGDAPIIGAGTYANNRTLGVSGTGDGEYFMRGVVAYDVSALMQYRGYSVEAALYHVVQEKLVDMGGAGGLIAVDKDGNIAMEFNTWGMYRGYVDRDGKVHTAIYEKQPRAAPGDATTTDSSDK